MAPAPVTVNLSPTKSTVKWRPTKIMNMLDLSKDDDFLSHLLVEKLGAGAVPLLVHKMDSSRRLPKTDADNLLQIVRRNVVTKSTVQHATRQAVDELLALPPIRYYLKPYNQKQINAFATHASRYFELYHPSGSIEIAHTSRYSHHTGKSELCILATRPLAPGAVITELKGSMANLTDEEDRELKRTDLRNSDIRRDFSVIHSKQMKKNHLFLGPARFVNHDCNNNCELFREGRYITFRVLRHISIGEEITAHYGDGYFGRNNRHCLCETCEKAGKGGYAQDHSEHVVHSSSESDSDSDAPSRPNSTEPEGESKQKVALNINERRTRRGVYAILQEEDGDSEESDDEENNAPLRHGNDIPADGQVELETEVEAETASELTPLPSSRSSSDPLTPPLDPGLMTPDPDAVRTTRMSSSHLSVDGFGAKSSHSTRLQRPAVVTGGSSGATANPGERIQQIVTPPLSEDSASVVDGSSSRRVTRSLAPTGTTMNKGKGREKAPTTSTTLATPFKDMGKQAGKTVAKGASEARVLRTRPVLVSTPADDAKSNLTKTEKPKGADGKPLPTCITCSIVLPVISVDAEMLLGGAEILSRVKGKKKVKQECPRCIRHFAIYAQPWPIRMPAHGTAFLPTPREDSLPAESATKRVTQKTLPTLDRKLAAAAFASSKSRHENVADERPTKKRKIEPGPRVDMSAKAKQVLLGRGQTRNGRYNHPGPKVQEEEPQKRKRGRPRLTSPTPKPEQTPEDSSPKLDAEALKNQPRDSNGRFGKKGSNGRFTRSRFAFAVGGGTSRAQRAIERGRVKSWLEQRDESETEKPGESASRRVTRKRSGEDCTESSKRMRSDRDNEVENQVQGPPFAFTFGRPVFGFKSVGLFRAPNPMSFAQRTWGMKAEFQETTSSGTDKDRRDDSPLTSADESDPPVTPDDHTPSIAISKADPNGTTQRRRGGLTDEEDDDEEDDAQSSKLKPVTPHPVVPLTFKPSPFNFARRRWASMSASSDAPSTTHLVKNASSEPVDNNAIDPENFFGTDSLNGLSLSSPSKSVDGMYVSQWLGGNPSSGQEDAVRPGSPDPSIFILHRASFGSESRPTCSVDEPSDSMKRTTATLPSDERLAV